jgi:serine/threonine protein kinase
MITKELGHGGGGYALVVIDPDLHSEFVLKLIVLGRKGSDLRLKHQKMIEKEIRVGMIVAKESFHLVSYIEIFEWEYCFCIKMEYCSNGDVQKQLDEGHAFTEEVFCYFFE